MEKTSGKLLTPKLLRVEKNWTQEYVARSIDMPLETYKKKEVGQHKWWAHEVFALSQLYDVSMDYIFLDLKCQKKTQKEGVN